MARKPTHPGKALLDDMCERDLKLTELSALLELDPEFVRELLAEHEDVTPDVSVNLAKLGPSAEFWLNMQRNHDAHESERVSQAKAG